MQKVETLEQKVQRLVSDKISVVAYDPRWAEMFRREKAHLQECLPEALIGRIEHFGSTAVPGLAAKPIIDMLVEVRSLDAVREAAPPILEAQGYEYLWRPTWGDDTPPFYAWFIKRDAEGKRTHHIHMVEADFEHWERLLFRDYLIEHPEVAQAYGELKVRLSGEFPNDRVKYTKAKTDFIERVTRLAKEFYCRA